MFTRNVLAAILFLVLCSVTYAQVDTVAVTGEVRLPSGVAATGGRILITLSQSGAVGGSVVAGNTVATIATTSNALRTGSRFVVMSQVSLFCSHRWPRMPGLMVSHHGG